MNYQKAFKKLTFFFFQTQSLLMDIIIKNKRGLELVTSHSSQVTKEVQKYSFIRYILSDQVWWCNVKQFLIYSKNYVCKFMQANWWHHKLFHFNLSFLIWKLWKERKTITKIWISWEWKDEIKNIFHTFLRAIIWRKNKSLIKNSGQKF